MPSIPSGVWGTLAVGLVHETKGGLHGGGWGQLGVQALGVVAVLGWVVLTTGLLVIILKYTIGLRVSEAEERAGLDYGEHAVESYPDFGVSSLG